MVDWIPVISQVKSLVQVTFGDTKGAARTQENFVRECPVISQGVSLGQLAAGDKQGAIETQRRFVGKVSDLANGVPLVGHAKGAIHYAVGDKEGGNRAMQAATRTTAVMGGGAAGFLIGGPPGAVIGGIYGGASADIVTTFVTDNPSGYIAAGCNIVKNPNPGDIFEAVLMPVADGMAGYSAGKITNRIQQSASNAANVNKLDALRTKKLDLLENARNDPTANSATVLKLGSEIKDLTAQIDKITGEQAMPGLKQTQSQRSTNTQTVTTDVNVAASSAAQTQQSRSQANTSEQEQTPQQQTPQQQTPQQQAPQQQAQQQQAPQQHWSTMSRVTRASLIDPDTNEVIESLVAVNDSQRLKNLLSHTVVAKMDNGNQGLLHMYLRHFTEFSRFVPELETDFLPRHMRDLAQQIESLPNGSARTRAIKLFMQALRETSSGTRERLRAMQLHMFDFLCNNMTDANYQRDEVNNVNSDRMSLWVCTDTAGNRVNLTTAAGRELYQATREIRNNFRELITAFFERTNPPPP